jgi:pyruvate dehydrogenase E2 component (dihydrolipoamide acetyltransferase)
MPIVAVRIPQIGEGLQEARLVAVLKQPGDKVLRDEPIYQMETDKAVMDVESPYEGILTEWLAEVDAILPIGGEVARMDVPEGTDEMVVHGTAETPSAMEESATAPAAKGIAGIPPRTRAYAKEKGISEEILATISAAGSKLMPADIDAYLSGGSPAKGYSESAVPSAQRLLASRMVRGNQIVVPGTEIVAVNWTAVENLRTRIKASGSDFQPSAFTMFSYAVTQAVKEFPAFRTILVGDNTFRTYDHVALGIAVARPGDELVLAVVEDADTLDWPSFAARMRERIDQARQGKDQASEAVTISLTNMQAFGLRDAVPVVVPPSVATLFLGEVYNGLAQDTEELKLVRTANLALTFDHRVINGVGAAQFLAKIKEHVESLSAMI